MRTIFELLERIRQRPNLYVGEETTHGDSRLQRIELFIAGYITALRDHSIDDSAVEFLDEFSNYLERSRDWSMSCGIAHAVEEAAGSRAAAWPMYWAMVDEFRAAVASTRPS